MKGLNVARKRGKRRGECGNNSGNSGITKEKGFAFSPFLFPKLTFKSFNDSRGNCYIRHVINYYVGAIGELLDNVYFFQKKIIPGVRYFRLNIYPPLSPPDGTAKKVKK